MKEHSRVIARREVWLCLHNGFGEKECNVAVYSFSDTQLVCLVRPAGGNSGQGCSCIHSFLPSFPPSFLSSSLPSCIFAFYSLLRSWAPGPLLELETQCCTGQRQLPSREGEVVKEVDMEDARWHAWKSSMRSHGVYVGTWLRLGPQKAFRGNKLWGGKCSRQEE